MAERLLLKAADPNRYVRSHATAGLIVSGAVAVAMVTVAVLEPDSRWGVVAVAALLGLFLFWLWTRTPIGYELNDESVSVRYKLAKPTVIPLDSLRDVREVDLDAFRVRPASSWVWEIGGLFALVGPYRNDSLGSLHAFVTSTERIVLLEGTGRHHWLISPGDPGRFVQEATARLAAAS